MRMIKHLSQCRTCEYSIHVKGKCNAASDCQQCENATNDHCHCCEAPKENETKCQYYEEIKI